MKTARGFIPVAEPDLDGREAAKVMDCLKSGWLSSIGAYVNELERSFSLFCRVAHGVACSNGTTALHLALLALGIGRGDEVLCPDLTFVASANAIRYTGADPVFVDSEPKTWNMDPAKIREKITPRTKAILVVHLYGHPADMDPIMEIARLHGLEVVEDAAEAHGALYRGRRVGSIGRIGCFSFYGNKIITTGEGGIAVTGDSGLADKMRLLRDHAMDPRRRYWHETVGYNYRLTNLQAAVGVAQLEKIEDFLRIRRENALTYASGLKGIPGVRLFPAEPWAQPSYWMISILVEDAFGINRDGLSAVLKEKGVDSRPFFIPMHLLPPYRLAEKFPVAEDLSRRGMNLPSSTLLTRGDIDYIVEIIRKAHV